MAKVQQTGFRNNSSPMEHHLGWLDGLSGNPDHKDVQSWVEPPYLLSGVLVLLGFLLAMGSLEIHQAIPNHQAIPYLLALRLDHPVSHWVQGSPSEGEVRIT